MSSHYTPARMAKIWNSNTTKCWQRCGAKEILITAGGGGVCAEWCSHLGRQFGSFLRN